jgi:hypothetical protein
VGFETLTQYGIESSSSLLACKKGGKEGEGERERERGKNRWPPPRKRRRRMELDRAGCDEGLTSTQVPRYCSQFLHILRLGSVWLREDLSIK